MKYLVLLIVLTVAVGIWRSRRSADDTPRQPPRQPAPPQDILACAHCGVHSPASRCVWRDGKPYCSDEHARLGS